MTGQLVGARLQPDQLAKLDAWMAAQPRRVSRPEAIRAMIDSALALLKKDTGVQRQLTSLAV